MDTLKIQSKLSRSHKYWDKKPKEPEKIRKN
jgi:hypothetical protein